MNQSCIHCNFWLQNVAMKSSIYSVTDKVRNSGLGPDPDQSVKKGSYLSGHPVSHVTLLVRPGKFASGLDFSGGRFFPSGGRFILFRGALIFFQGGTFSPVKKARLNSGGLKPP